MFLNELQLLPKTKDLMKVKLFVSHALETIEQDINKWLAQDGIKVHHVTQSQSEKQGKFVFVVSFFYATSD